MNFHNFLIPCLLLGSIVASCSQEAQIVEIQPASCVQYSIDQFLNTKSYGAGTFSFDEQKVLFSSNETGVFNVFSMDINAAKQIQLTHSQNNTVVLVAALPSDDRFLFTTDNLGDEIYHIYLQELDGSVRDLTPDAEARALVHSWSYDLKSIFYTSNRRDPKFMDLYKMDIDHFVPVLIFQNDQGFMIGDVSPDRHYLSLTKAHSSNDSDLYLYDFDTQTLKNLTPHSGQISNGAACFTPDSKNLYFLTDEASDYTYLKCYNIESQDLSTVAKDTWDIIACGFSRDGRYRSIIVNEDGSQHVRVFDLLVNEPVALPKLPDGDIVLARVSRSSKKMLLATDGDRSPINYYVYDLETKECTKLTNALSPDMNINDLVESEVVRYSSYDGLAIPALYYKPHEASGNTKVPALIWVHGGPGGQCSKGYNGLIQYLVNQGYAILAVNNRGSSGYGKSFYKAADRKHGEADLDDCIWAKKFLIATGHVDENKIGIIGGSYGGYMTLAALAFRPQEMAVGIDIFGVSNWIQTLTNIPAWWENERDMLYEKIGNPKTDEAYLKSISPLFHADNIVKPLLVIQGANDPRVLQTESDEIVAAVRKNNVPCEYVLYADEGHGFSKKENQRYLFKTISKFLDNNLKCNK